MTVAFDIDGTWDRDPEAWLTIYRYLQQRGWQCIIVTGREQPPDKLARLGIPDSAVVIVSGPLLKEKAAQRAGYHVQVWIDDMPGMIQECRILGETNFDTQA